MECRFSLGCSILALGGTFTVRSRDATSFITVFIRRGQWARFSFKRLASFVALANHLRSPSCAVTTSGRLDVPSDLVHVLQMSSQVATLREVLFADVTLVGSLHRVLPKVVAQIATLSEDGFTALILTPKVQFGSFRLAIVNLNRFVPLPRNPFELLGKRGLSLRISRTFPWHSTILLFLGA